jgi:O-antigen biosynthesis protein
MNRYNVELNLEDRNSLSVLVGRIKPNSIVLEFGPANGRMTKYMKEQLNCKIYAVEIDENSAKDAKKYTERIIVDSIENYSWQKEFKELKFDYIIFADVLEHLYYPDKVLKNCNEFLKEDGSILVSIPNIAHNAIVLNLLKNQFDYSPIGLLDDTHIRFFTKQTFDDLIKGNGYFVSFETAIYLEPKNTEFKNNYDEIPELFGTYLANLAWGEVYQYIYEFKKYKVEKISDFNENYKISGNDFLQLFIENGNGFIEEDSIKFPILKNNGIQKFEFDLRNKNNITSLRLDPLNDSCVIKIENLYLLQKDGTKLELMDSLFTNSCSSFCGNYFFENIDPQIYFENLDLKILSLIEKLCVELKYTHISKDALHVCVKQITSDKNHIEDKNLQLEDKNLQLEDKNLQLQNSLYSLENELIDIYTSISWKITRPLRNIIKKIKNKKR